jgi:nitroreductase
MSTNPSPRIPNAAVDPLFLDRWSPRAFSPEPIPSAIVDRLFEAARWAPSSMNEQPWLFVRATAPKELELVRSLLVPGNRSWADRAPLLAVLFAKRKFARNGNPNRHASFDAGAAWMSLALAAAKVGLFAHAMGGFDSEGAAGELGLDPAEWEAMAVIAVGRRGDPSRLPAEIAAREKPTPRKPLSEVVHDGAFPKVAS